MRRGSPGWIRQASPREKSSKKDHKGEVIMRRLIFMLAAGLLAAGTVLTTDGVASAGAAPIHRETNCSYNGPYYLSVTSVSSTYYVGTSSKVVSGRAAILKPTKNDTTAFNICLSFTVANQVLIENRNLVLTSTSRVPGADVTMTSPGNGGNGFASQLWILSAGSTSGTWNLANKKTGLSLRVRNSGPSYSQSVTTGASATDWTPTFG